MTNKEIAAVLYEIGQLLELQEENIFKIRAYQNAARSLELLDDSVEDLVAAGNIQKVPGIGKAIAARVEELVTTGRLSYHEQLKGQYPATLAELLRVPNLGPRKIRTLFDQLGIASIAELRKACVENHLVDVKGFGKRTQEKILEGIGLMEASEGQFLISQILPIARDILAYLRECKAIEQVEIAGAVRRWKEILGALDFVASSTRSGEVAEHFVKTPLAARVEERTDSKVSLRLFTRGLPAHLHLVKPPEFAPALHYFTGSKDHVDAVHHQAKLRGYKVNEHGVFRGKSSKSVPAKTEHEFFGIFDMDYVPPELREGLGEVEAALEHRVPDIVELSDIQGIFHVHSLYSDGNNTLEEMIAAASKRGHKYVGISEHSKIAYYAGGLDEKRLAQQGHEIDQLRKKYKEIAILKGIEVDILMDGTLDMPDEVLANLDFVIASVHSGFKMNEPEMTARICKALSHPHVDILGHATGRLLLARKSYAVNIEEVLKTAGLYRKTIEINASPRRLELDWRLIRRAKELGIRLSINPDAHSIAELDYVPYGVGMARKGWATPEDILNTRTWPQIRRLFERT